MGVAAATEALADAGLLESALDRPRVGVLLGAGTADLLRNEMFYNKWMTSGIERARKSDVWNHFSNTPADIIAHRFGFEGFRSCVVAACSSSTIAIGQAADAVRRGRADAVSGRRHRCVVAPYIQRLQRAAAHGSESVPAVRSRPSRHEHRRRGRHPGPRVAGTGPAARRPHLWRAGGLRFRMRSVPSHRSGTRGTSDRVRHHSRFAAWAC